MVEFLEAAEVELEEAIAFYEGRAEGLGERFLREVQLATLRLENHPRSGTPIVHRHVPPGTRQLALPIFPYHIVYSEPDMTIVAIAHQKREPRYWVGRTGRST